VLPEVIDTVGYEAGDAALQSVLHQAENTAAAVHSRYVSFDYIVDVLYLFVFIASLMLGHLFLIFYSDDDIDQIKQCKDSSSGNSRSSSLSSMSVSSSSSDGVACRMAELSVVCQWRVLSTRLSFDSYQVAFFFISCL